jgi:hypothetical protein
MQVSRWLGYESDVTALTVHADDIDTEEGIEAGVVQKGERAAGRRRGTYRRAVSARALAFASARSQAATMSS